jgi:hypothetical protein
MTQTNDIVLDAADQLHTVISDYNRTVVGGNIDSDTVAGKALRRKNILELDKLSDKLEIESLKQLDKLELNSEQMKRLVNLYIRDLEQAKRVLKNKNQDGLADELEFHQIKRLENLKKNL